MPERHRIQTNHALTASQTPWSTLKRKRAELAMNEQKLKEEEERYMDIMNDCANQPTNQPNNPDKKGHA